MIYTHPTQRPDGQPEGTPRQAPQEFPGMPDKHMSPQEPPAPAPQRFTQPGERGEWEGSAPQRDFPPFYDR